MRRWAWVLAVGAGAALASCGPRRPTVVATPHYVIGAPYQAGGAWYYPHEAFRYDATGLAERLPDRRGQTADGEVFDPAGMAGSHQTLQLPAIARVTNLQNGRRIRVRLNDRGPDNPGRIIGLTRRAADLLDLPPDGAAPVRVEVESGPSQALRDRLQGGPKGITAAPVGAVLAESLPAPGSRAAPVRVAPAPAQDIAAPSADLEVPDQLPPTVEQTPLQPGRLWLRAGQFSQPGYANAVKTNLSLLPVEVRREQEGRTASFVVMAGPFASVAAADRALDQARSAGVTDAVIVVE